MPCEALWSRRARFSAVSLIEAARMAVLPWMREGEYHVDPDASAAHVELLALIVLAAEAQAGGPPTGEVPEVQEMSHLISHAKDDLDLLLNLSHLRAAMTVDRSDKLAFISMLVRGSQVMVRNTSYADMAEQTVTDLLDGRPECPRRVGSGLGFDAHDATQVLTAVHKIQQDQVNDRGRGFADALNDLRDTAEAATQREAQEPDSAERRAEGAAKRSLARSCRNRSSSPTWRHRPSRLRRSLPRPDWKRDGFGQSSNGLRSTSRVSPR